MSDMKVRDAAASDVTCVPPALPLHEVAERLTTDPSACLVVCTDDGPTGTITDRDMVRFLGRVLRGQAAALGTAETVMSRLVLTAGPGDDLVEVAAVMHEADLRCIPVVDDGSRVIGLLQSQDIIRATADALRQQRDHLEREVERRTEELRDANEALRALSRRDSLTGLGNRRAMEEALAQVHASAVRYRRPYAVILADVDHFKSYNDTYGHQAGDDCLRDVADAVQAGLRTSDEAFRYGGEELLILLPESSGADAAFVAERLRAEVEGRAIPHEGSSHGLVTMSLGVAAYGEVSRYDNWELIAAAADNALYRAKESGRNQVQVASPLHDRVQEPVEA